LKWHLDGDALHGLIRYESKTICQIKTACRKSDNWAVALLVASGRIWFKGKIEYLSR
jgi:hypothetical protein